MHARSQQMLNDLSKVIGLKEQLVLDGDIGKKTMVVTLLFQNWHNENFPDDTIIPDEKLGKVTRKLLRQELKKIKPALTDSIGIVPQNGGTPDMYVQYHPSGANI